MVQDRSNFAMQLVHPGCPVPSLRGPVSLVPPCPNQAVEAHDKPSDLDRDPHSSSSSLVDNQGLRFSGLESITQELNNDRRGQKESPVFQQLVCDFG